MVTSVNGVAYIAAPALGVLLYGWWMPLPFVATAAGMVGAGGVGMGEGAKLTAKPTTPTHTCAESLSALSALESKPCTSKR